MRTFEIFVKIDTEESVKKFVIPADSEESAYELITNIFKNKNYYTILKSKTIEYCEYSNYVN